MQTQSFQHGHLRIRHRARGPAVWEYRFRVPNERGVRVQRCMTVGSTVEYPTVGEARAAIRGIELSINVAANFHGCATVGDAIDRFIVDERVSEIIAGTATGSGLLHYATAKGYLRVFTRYVRPRWGTVKLSEVRPAVVHQWLMSLSIAPKTKANIRGVLRRLFEKAMLWELIQIQRNPIDLVKIRGVSKRRRMPTVLTPEQFAYILSRLSEPLRTMVLVAQCTGLRVSEILGLQWSDFDFEHGTFKVTRGVVHGRVDHVKTEYSEDLLPLNRHVAEALLAWHPHSVPTAAGWVFASPITMRPHHGQSIEKRRFRALSEELGVRIGWHTFRHTYRSWLDAAGVPVGVQQKLMRHAQVATTMNVYGNALMGSKRDANTKVVAMAMVPLTVAPESQPATSGVLTRE